MPRLFWFDTMKSLTKIVAIGSFLSGLALACTSINSETTEDSFKVQLSKGVLIDYEVSRLETYFKNVKQHNGILVNIIGVSDSLFNKNKDYCLAYHKVKVSLNSLDTLVLNGRNVYEIQSNESLWSYDSGLKKLSIFRTLSYGINAWDNDGLTFCSSYFEPAYLELNDSIFGLANIHSNKIFEENFKNENFNFLEFGQNDAFVDSVVNCSEQNGEFYLTVERHYHESKREYSLVLRTEGSKIIAEYLKVSGMIYSP